MSRTPLENTNKQSESRVSCRVPRKLMRRLEKVARTNGMDVSDVVRMSLYRILPQYEQSQNGKAQPA
jgi:metal-responsive CopG/Arc/MetJ family transcriptional regulator